MLIQSLVQSIASVHLDKLMLLSLVEVASPNLTQLSNYVSRARTSFRANGYLIHNINEQQFILATLETELPWSVPVGGRCQIPQSENRIALQNPNIHLPN